MGQQIHIAAHSPLLAGWLVVVGACALRGVDGGGARGPACSSWTLLFEKEHRKIGFNTQNKSGDYD